MNWLDILIKKKGKTYQVSIRAPKNNLIGADEIASKFGGGGRKGAAGIDGLAAGQLQRVGNLMEEKYV